MSMDGLLGWKDWSKKQAWVRARGIVPEILVGGIFYVRCGHMCVCLQTSLHHPYDLNLRICWRLTGTHLFYEEYF